VSKAATRRFFPALNARTAGWACTAWLLLMALPALAQTPPKDDERVASFEVQATPVKGFDLRDPERRQFGALTFRSGIELNSHQPGFGGLSSIRVFDGGTRFVMVSDRGRWLRGKLNYDGERLVSLSQVEMAPMLGEDGKPLALKGWFDTESLADDGGIFYVGIERVNQIVRFDFGKDGFSARGKPIDTPPQVKKLPYNKGLEGMTFVPRNLPLGGTLIAISERGLDEAGNIMGFLIGGPTPGMFTVARTDDFDVTEAAVTPQGDLLILERSFSLLKGAGMRIRRVPLKDVKPGALIKGEVLFEADRNYLIDNMEGLAVHTDANGDTVLTILSDDNFNPLQRILLLQFTLSR
jgi:hypothetical protein